MLSISPVFPADAALTLYNLYRSGNLKSTEAFQAIVELLLYAGSRLVPGDAAQAPVEGEEDEEKPRRRRKAEHHEPDEIMEALKEHAQARLKKGGAEPAQQSPMGLAIGGPALLKFLLGLLKEFA